MGLKNADSVVDGISLEKCGHFVGNEMAHGRIGFELVSLLAETAFVDFSKRSLGDFSILHYRC